jgi:hypothetical protein
MSSAACKASQLGEAIAHALATVILAIAEFHHDGRFALTPASG